MASANAEAFVFALKEEDRPMTHPPITRLQAQEPQKLEQIIQKVRALRALTTSTGFMTTRSVGLLLANLSPDELVKVSEALELTPREMPRSR